MTTEYAILPHVAHMAAVQDAKNALTENAGEGNIIDREALRDAQYETLVTRFLDAADNGLKPFIPEASLQVYHDAFDSTWMGA